MNHYERRVFSQNGEDGILDEIFRRLAIECGQFLEIGAHDGEENCTRHLLVDCGWRGAWVEGDSTRVAHAIERFSGSDVRILQEFVTVENAATAVERAGIPDDDLTLLVVDVDGNDYWLVERLLPTLRPSVLVVEYNAWFGPKSWWVMPYDSDHSWDDTARHGASIAAFHWLARRCGYRLVGGDQTGTNLFFVREALAAAAEPSLPALSPADAYHVPKYRLLGHPPARPPRVGAMSTLSEEESARVAMTRDRIFASGPVVPGSPIFATVTVSNGTERWLASESPHPIHIAYRWIDDRGEIVVDEGIRTPLVWPMAPGARRLQPLRAEAPVEPGDYCLRITLVQEGVRWFDQPPLHLACEAPVAVRA